MTLELHINNQIADIDEDTEINLTKEWESDDDDSMERKQTEYSYELELPITANNQKIFGYANDIQVKHKFYQAYEAQLYADHILVLDGKFMLTEIDKDTFTGNLYVPSTKDLSDILGDKNLNEIKAHGILLDSIYSFRDLNMEALGQRYGSHNKYVIFPYILYNFARSNFDGSAENKYVQLTDPDNTTFDFDNIYPAFNVLKVIEEIFDTYGYKVSGNIFNDKRFTELWMTSSFDNDDYKDNLKYPQYMDLCGYYYNLKTNSDGSYTKSNTNAYYEDTDPNGYATRYYCDDLLHSGNTQLWTAQNQHKIFQPSGDQGSVIVRRSGWYQIYFDGYVEMNNNGYNDDEYDGRQNSFLTSMAEIRLVKGEARQNTKFHSRFGEAPIVPRSVDVNNMGEGVDRQTQSTVCGWANADVREYIKIPDQGRMATVYDYSTFDTSNFICGARFGNSLEIMDWFNSGMIYTWNNRASYITKRNVKYALPHSEYCSTLAYDIDRNDESYMLPLYWFKDTNFNTVYPKPAVTLVSENAKFSNTGYITNTPFSGTYTYNNHKYKTSYWRYNQEQNMLKDIRTNTASIAELTSGDIGFFKCGCVYYLEEGDVLNVELGTTLAYANFAKSAPVTKCYFNIQMGLLSTDKAWEPDNNKNTIPNLVTVLNREQETNINQFLPDMTCNDFLESFMKTFNLRVTKIADKEYSINYSDTRQTTLNIVPLDKYFDASKVTEKSIDIPSEYNWTFNNDTDEEGYTTGDDSPFNEATTKAENEKPNYEGNKTIENQVNTTDDTEDVESRFSYNWYKTIWATTKEEYDRWITAGKPSLSRFTHTGKVLKVPVIADADVWDKSFSDGQEENDKVSGTPRFFYIDYDNTVSIKSYDAIKLLFPVPTNTYNDSFDLDFNSIPSFTGIEETFFSTKVTPSYEIYVEMALSNEDYKKIEENTLIKLNGELFRVVKIDGHDVTMQDDADVVLKALV